MFKSTGLAKMFAGRRKFFRGPHVRHLCSKLLVIHFRANAVSIQNGIRNTCLGSSWPS